MTLENKYTKYLRTSHTYIGLFAIVFFYISTVFGTITVFKPYINSWESPSKHFSLINQEDLNLDQLIDKGLVQLNNPTNNIKITLPSSTEKAVAIKYGFSENVYINPHSNQIVKAEYENSLLSTFFNQMHINVNMSKTGQFIMGLTSISMVFLTISGIYLWLLNRKKRTKISNFWLRWHKDLSLLILPYILVFALTGAVLGIMLTMASPFAYSASDAKETNMSKIVRPIIFSKPTNVKSLNQPAQMKAYSYLFKKAQKNYQDLHITDITLYNWKDKNARAVFNGYLKNNRILTATVNRVNIVLNGVTGEIVRKKTLENSHKVSQLLSAFYFFHFISDEDILVRILYLLVGIGFAIGLVFGLFVWIDKKVSKDEKKYFNIITKLSAAFSIGIIPSISFTLFLYWLLPFELHNRDTWIIGGFYVLWSFTFLWSVYKSDVLDATKTFIYLNSYFLILAVFLHGYRTDMYLWDSFNTSVNDIFYMDLSLLFFGIVSFFIAYKMNQLKFLDRFKGY